MKFNVVDSDNSKHYRLSPSMQRHRVAMSGFMTLAAVTSTAATDAIKYEWEIEGHHLQKSTDDVFYKDTDTPLRNHPIDHIGTGTSRELDVEAVMASLDEHKGVFVPKNCQQAFRNTLKKFSGVPYRDCVSIYSKVNRFITTTIVLDYDLCFNFTFFVDRDTDMIPYSVSHMGESVVVGSTSSDELASGLRKFLKSVAQEYGSVSC